MKHNISDLLDNVYVDDIEMNSLAPLSPRRIKARTMEKIGTKNVKKHRWLGRIAVAAAVIAMMTLTVFAADTVLNDGAMWDKLFGKDLSEDQIQLIDDIGRTFGEGVTCNGATITPLYAVADEQTYYMHIQVEAPEGVVLPDVSEEDGCFYRFDYDDYDRLVKIDYQLTPNESRTYYPNYGITALPDDNPTDNVKEMVVSLGKNGSDINILFNGDMPKRLTIYGLYIHYMDERGCERLFTGSFCFDMEIGIGYEDRDAYKLVVDTGGVSFYNEEYAFTTTIKKVTIMPFCIIVERTSTDANSKYIFPQGGPIEIVMKDGSVAYTLEPYYDAAAHKYPHPDSVVGIGNRFKVDKPLVLEDIDYIRINGEYIFDVN